MLSAFQKLRQEYRKLVFTGWDSQVSANRLELVFKYRLVGQQRSFDFRHSLDFAMKSGSLANVDIIDQWETLIFHLGLMETINYWKLACPAEIEIKCGYLSPEQQAFWQKLFYKGLGEFIYLNRLHDPAVAGFELRADNLVTFRSDKRQSRAKMQLADRRLDGLLVPVGGGKDSVLSLEILAQQSATILPMLMSAPQAAYDCVAVAGYQNYLEIKRRLDSQILTMNHQGFLNGHVPFSAILAFAGLLGAVLGNKAQLVLSNENSANEASVLEAEFNHQYSKSIEFELDFRDYVKQFISDELNYFSLLRPLEELEVAKLFANYPRYHQVFRSCNVGKKTNTWCGQCPKCLFVFIMLAAFMEYDAVVKIFGKDLLADKQLLPILRQLIGLEAVKPFECVGTISESRRALALLAQAWPVKVKERPFLLEQFINYQLPALPPKKDERHCLPKYFLEQLTAERLRYGLL